MPLIPTDISSMCSQKFAGGWKAFFISDPSVWEYGTTQAEALGKLVITFASAQRIDLEVNFDA
jgi:hypothetical protein